MTVHAVAGTKFYIGTSETVASPDDYIEVGNIRTFPPWGGTTFNKIAVESVGSGYTKQIKGTELAPPADIVLNYDPADAGQAAMETASTDRNNLYNCKVVGNDGPPENAVATEWTFRARIYGWAIAGGGVNDLHTINTSLEIEPDTIVKTPAHP